ncbi:MAG: pyridoxamine 5'-phosphate oxidase [Symploca sp. SIO2C1]|nr:pyridoxamine 5'-phosphate oxidase [Symploca sp. SIO2C1]
MAPWRLLLTRALDKNSNLPYSRYFQLATVAANGYPANRTVVFRGFLDDTNQLKFITDSRSQKVEQIQHQSWGEACWYFPDTREQFRLAGKLMLVGADAPNQTWQNARKTTWQNLSDSARLQFTWPHPGEVKDKDDSAFFLSPPAPEKPLPNFCLVLLEPARVEHLNLRDNPQSRWLYQLDEGENWSTQAINP